MDDILPSPVQAVLRATGDEATKVRKKRDSAWHTHGIQGYATRLIRFGLAGSHTVAAMRRGHPGPLGRARPASSSTAASNARRAASPLQR